MRRILHLVLVLCVLWCSADGVVLAQVHEHLPGGQFEAVADWSDEKHQGQAGDDAEHHHCPVAPDTGVAGFKCFELRASVAVFAKLAAPLASLSRAPPVEPPSA